MAAKLGVAPSYFTSFVDGQGLGAINYVNYAVDLDTNFAVIKVTVNDMIDEINAVNGTNFLVSFDLAQFSDTDNGLFNFQAQGVLGGHSYSVAINGGDTTQVIVQKGQAIAQAQRAKSDSVVNLTGFGGASTLFVAIDGLGTPTINATSGSQVLDIASITWDGAQFTGTVTQLAHIFWDGDEYTRMRYRPDDSAIWATGGTPALANHKAFRVFADRVQALERMITGRNTELDTTALPVMGFTGTAPLPGLIGTDGAGVRDTTTGFFRVSANLIGFSALAGESLRFSSQGLSVKLGTPALPSIHFLGDTDSGMFRQAANVIGFATAGVERIRISSAGIQVVPLGTVGAPSFAWTTATNTGLYLESTTRLAFATGGVKALELDATQHVLGIDGTALRPTFSFLNDTDSGFRSAGADRVALVTGGADALEVDAAGNTDLILQTRGEATATNFNLLTGTPLLSITLDAEVRDVGGSFAPSSADIVIPTDGDGTYLVCLEVDFDEANSDGTPGAGNREIAIEFNGAQRGRVFQPATNATRTTLSTSFEADLTAGQIIRARAAQDSGGVDMNVDARITWRKSA